MRLFEPAELLAMRAIGEHARGVAQHRLLDQVVRLHEQLLARIEPPALMQIGMDELARQRDDGNVVRAGAVGGFGALDLEITRAARSEEHTSELQSLMRTP